MTASARQQAVVAERHRRLLEAMGSGLTVEQIAALDGSPGSPAEWAGFYGGRPGRVAQDARRALAARASYDAEIAANYVALELGRLDAAERRVQTVIVKAASAGNSDQVLRAVDRLIRLSARRGELLGLDADKATRNPAGPAPDDGDELAVQRRRRRRMAARLRQAQQQ